MSTGVALLLTVFAQFSMIPCRDMNASLHTCWVTNTHILTKYVILVSMVKRIRIQRSWPFHRDLKKSVYSFLCKNLYCKNVEVEIKFDFKGQINQKLDIFPLSSMCLLGIKETYSEVSNELDEASQRYFILHNRRAVGKIVGNKTCDVTVGELKKCGNLKLFWIYVHNELQRKTTENQKLAHSVPPRPKTFLKENGSKDEKRMSSKGSRVCVKHFTEDSFKHNLVVTSLLVPSFNLCQLVCKKDAVLTIFNFTMKCCKPSIGQKATKNKRIMLAEQQANSFDNDVTK